VSLRGLQSPAAVERAFAFGFSLIVLVPILGYSRLLGVICEAHQRFTAPAAMALLNPLTFVTILAVTRPALGTSSLLLANIMSATVELAGIGAYVVRNLHVPLTPKATIHRAVREMLLKSLAPALTFALYLCLHLIAW
jgi:hypothetical protein